jgi:hypothetical protein
MTMQRVASLLLGIAVVLGAVSAARAHHSFAIYDMRQNVEFHGTVKSVKFRNPHMALTLSVKGDGGVEQTVEFVEGAPANMLARLGLRPEFIAPGQEITAIGAPRHDNPAAWFIKAIVLADGTRFNSLQTPGQER